MGFCSVGSLLYGGQRVLILVINAVVILWEISDQLEMMVRVKIIFVLDPKKAAHIPKVVQNMFLKYETPCVGVKVVVSRCVLYFFSQDQCIDRS